MALVIAPSISYTAEMLSADVIGLRQRASNWCLVGLIAGGISAQPDIWVPDGSCGRYLNRPFERRRCDRAPPLVVASVIGGFLFRAMLPRPVG